MCPFFKTLHIFCVKKSESNWILRPKISIHFTMAEYFIRHWFEIESQSSVVRRISRWEHVAFYQKITRLSGMYIHKTTLRGAHSGWKSQIENKTKLYIVKICSCMFVQAVGIEIFFLWPMIVFANGKLKKNRFKRFSTLLTFRI